MSRTKTNLKDSGFSCSTTLGEPLADPEKLSSVLAPASPSDRHCTATLRASMRNLTPQVLTQLPFNLQPGNISSERKFDKRSANIPKSMLDEILARRSSTLRSSPESAFSLSPVCPCRATANDSKSVMSSSRNGVISRRLRYRSRY